MMQELLLALLGYDGPIFQLKKDNNFQIPEGILTESEDAVIQSVLGTALHYTTILKFCRENRSGNGRYRAALAAALTDVTLPYRESVVSLERTLLDRPQLTVTHLRTALHDHTPLLRTLALLVKQVTDVRGCRILEPLHRVTNEAVHGTRALLHGVEQRVAGVLYDQLSQWLLYGALFDPHKEFFLQLDQDGEVSLEPSLLPCHLPATLAHKALFVGRAVRDFQGDPDGSNSRLLQDHETRFLLQLTQLREARVFCLLRLTQALEAIRATVSQHLCSVAVSAGVVDALCRLKGVMLLGRGELYRTLLATAGDLLDGPINTAANVSAAFYSCAQMVQVEETLLEGFTICCSQAALDSLPQVVRDTKGHGDTGWSSLQLSYCGGTGSLGQLLQTAGVQRSYSRLFAFLLCVRRAQHRIHRVTSIKTKRPAPSDRLTWTLRHHMTLLLDGLQYYLQVDVIESEHYCLVQSLNDCSDYQQLQCLITAYLSSLTSHCFLHHSLVSTCLATIFSLCHRLSNLLQDTESPDLEVVSSSFSIATRQLFLVLCSLQQRPGQQHTARLLARIDYNRHYRDAQEQRALLSLNGEDD